MGIAKELIDNYPITVEFLNGKSFTDIGIEMNISRERVRQKANREIKHLIVERSILAISILNTVGKYGITFAGKHTKTGRLYFLLTRQLGLKKYNGKQFIVLYKDRNRLNTNKIQNIILSFGLPLPFEEIFRRISNPIILSYAVKKLMPIIRNTDSGKCIVYYKRFCKFKNLNLYIDNGVRNVNVISALTKIPRAKMHSILLKRFSLTVKDNIIVPAMTKQRSMNRTIKVATMLTAEVHQRLKSLSIAYHETMSTFVYRKISSIPEEHLISMFNEWKDKYIQDTNNRPTKMFIMSSSEDINNMLGKLAKRSAVSKSFFLRAIINKLIEEFTNRLRNFGLAEKTVPEEKL